MKIDEAATVPDATWTSVLSFGAVGDGFANDTEALQNAIDATAGRTLYVPKGKYLVTSTLFIRDPCHHIVGDFRARFVDGGTEIVYTGTGPCIQIGADTGVAWDANFYGGPQGQLLENLLISHGAPDTNLASAGSDGSHYKAGAYGIWDWYGGDIMLNRISIERFEANFVGIQSDINTFNDIVSLYSKYGIYVGPRSDQFTIRDLYSFFCDRAVTIDVARQTRILDAQIVGCGTSTASAIEVRLGSGGICIDRPWFEHLQGYTPAGQISFVSVGEVNGYGAGGTIQSPGATPETSPVEGLSIERPLAYTTAAGSEHHTNHIATVGKCRRFQLSAPTVPPHISLGNLDSFVAVPASQSPTSADTQVKIDGVDSGVGPSLCFQNLGSGTPTSSIWTSGASGLILFDNVVLGAASGNSHTFRGRTTVACPPGATSTIGLGSVQASTGQTVGTVAIRGRQEGSYNTTTGLLISVGALGQSISTRSAGANPLRNVGVQATASGGQDNRALETVDGDVQLNALSGMTSINKSVRMPSELVPPPLGASADNYNPPGLSDALALLVSSTTPITLTGLATGAPGRWLWVYNIGANTITLKHQLTSLAPNRIIGRGGADTPLAPNTGVWLYYSGSQSRWIVTV